MKILKFGGTSVANANNIKLVLKIIESTSKEDQLVIAVSAFSGVTDLLVLAATNAAEKDNNYKTIYSQIENKHHEAIKELIPLNLQEGLFTIINSELNQLKTLLFFIYLSLC